MTASVCVFEGQDAAPEAMRPTIDLLRSLDVDLDLVFPPVDDHLDDLAAGEIPPPIKDPIDGADAVLFGAARGTGNTLIRVLRYLRREYGGGLPANVRPVRYIDGARSPLADHDDIDYAVVRETMEGEFYGVEGDLDEVRDSAGTLVDVDPEAIDALGEGTYALKVVSRPNVERFTRAVCEFALDRFDHRPITLTCATKSNVLRETDGLFDAVVEETVAGFDEVEYEHLFVDHAGALMIGDPQRFDLVVTTNAPGDILSDVGVATIGGLGLAPSGSFGGDRAYFEPVHGTAPDIVGEGVINPTATILSAVMMLDYLGFSPAADRLESAVTGIYAEGGPLTPDQGGSASTEEMAAAIADRL